jgi:hypothetical protein
MHGTTNAFRQGVKWSESVVGIELQVRVTISQAAYADLCKIPATITTVEKIYNAQTDING